MSLSFVVPVSATEQTEPSPLAYQAFRATGEAIDSTAPTLSQWWTTLGDPVLDRLINQGLTSAPGIVAASERVAEARAKLTHTQRDRLPNITTGMAYGRVDNGDNLKDEASLVGFEARWELDLWGAGARRVDMAQASAGRAVAELADAQVSLSAEIARAYLSLRRAQADSARLTVEYDAAEEQVRLSRQRAEAGLTGQAPVAEAIRRLSGLTTQMAENAVETAVQQDLLAILTGQVPGALVLDPVGGNTDPIPLPPAIVSIGDPASLIARRPDVRAAAQRVAGAKANRRVAEVARLPAVQLLGLIGLGGTGAPFDAGHLASLAVPQLRWSLLDFGRGAAAVRGAKAAERAVIANYNQAVLVALQDVEAALRRYGAARIAYGQARIAADQTMLVARMDQYRVQTGVISHGAGLASDMAASVAERSASDARLRLTLSYVILAKALGLGWETSARE